jgi:C-terminal processing protease CtpA/Prc
VNRTEISGLVEALIGRLDESYVFPERAALAAQRLRQRLADGAYADLDGPELCERISADLLETTEDKHLRLLWHEESGAEDGGEQFVTNLLELFRLENQGVRRVERLPGNIGLIELTLIPPAGEAGRAIVAAMELVANTGGLILDLRETRGGSPDGVAFLCSYFVPDGDIHLTDVVEGPHGPTRQFWTASYVPGARYLDRPIHVLTSGETFSGGEELAFDLQALGRATVVGETTKGGAHPSAVVPLTEQIELRLPVARTLNPVTGANWEAVGVQPDVPTPAADALETARRSLLEHIASDPTQSEAGRAEARQLLEGS